MSTKSTLLYGKNFHVYTEAFDYLPTVQIKGKTLELPKDFLEVLKKLIDLHYSVKSMIGYCTELDKVDGGLFMINTKTGKMKEFK